MLNLFITEPDKRFQCDLITEPEIFCLFKDFGCDEAFNETKHIGVSTTPDLTQENFFLGFEKFKAIHEGDAIRKEFSVWLKAPAPEHITIDIPPHALRCFDTLGVVFLKRLCCGFHDCLSLVGYYFVENSSVVKSYT